MPWPRLYSAAETSCNRRNQRSTRDGENPRNGHSDTTDSSRPSPIPISGAKTMKVSVFDHPEAISEPKPALAMAAPA